MGWSAYRDSPTLNEVAHLAAGISHWQFGRFELYRVNPPLARMVAALPVWLIKPKTDWHGAVDLPGSRSEFSVGNDFVAANGTRSIWYYVIGRWACIPFSLLGAYVCWRWAGELYGSGAGYCALSLWVFSPEVLAHGHLVTPDMAAASLGAASAYVFFRWLKQPDWKWAIGAGIVLGLAELTKLTLILFFAIWPLLWIFRRLMFEAFLRQWMNRARECAQLLSMLGVALFVLNQGYAFDGSFTPLCDYQFVSEALAGPVNSSTKEGNRFRDHWIGKIPIPLPKDYLLGIDSQRIDFEQPGQESYLRGHFQRHGWWYFYLYALAVKVPLGTWLLGLLAALMWFSRRVADFRDDLVVLFPGLMVFIFVSLQTGFTNHLRYVLPAFPFACVWASQVVAHIPRLSSRMVIGISTWSVLSSLWIYPHSLSYFNELTCGPAGGHTHLLNSNIDWGQDLIYLKDWLEEHPDARPFHLAYYGDFDPRMVDIQFDSVPEGPDLESEPNSPPALKPGWYAVSVNLLHGYPATVILPSGHRKPFAKNAFAYWQTLRAVDRAGYSIHIYFVPAVRR